MVTGVAPYRARLTRSARHWLAKFLEAELAGAALEATVWRAKHARNIPQSEELLQRRMIEREDQSHYVVTLLGLATASGAQARSTLSHCERLFSALRRHYSLDPKSPILAVKIAERIRLPGPQVLQIAKFLQRSPAYLSIHLGPDGPSLFPNEQYVIIKDFAALLDQARNQKDLTALQPLGFIGTIDKVIPASSEPASTPSLTKGHCPRCGPERQAIISSQHMETWEESSVSGSETYNILKCGGCGEVYFQRLSDCSEDRDYAYDEHGEMISFARPKITYWPAPVVRSTPPWAGGLADDILRNVLQEVYGALNADFRTLAAIGARTVLDRAMALLQAPDAEGFIARLKDLVQRQLISPHEKDILGVLTEAGNASAHRGWRPTPENLATIMDGIENFLHRLFVIGAATDAMKAHVPPRPPRSKVSKPTP
jgi:hypothetical protein